MSAKSNLYAKLDTTEKPAVRRRRRTKADLARLGFPVEESDDDGEMPHDSEAEHQRMNELRSNEFLYLLRKHHGC